MTTLKDQTPLSAKETMITLGDPGTQRYGGFFSEEPNAAWRDDARVDLVEEMRRSDGTVKAILNALKAPILSAEWMITSNDESPKGEQIKEKIEDDLFNMKQRSWHEFVRESLTYLEFGHSCFELIWGMKDGRISLIDLDPRIQSSILSWQLSDGRRGIRQLIATDESDKESVVEIPMNKMLVLTHEQEGADITGISVLRAAYKHYYAKDKLYRIGLIASERHGVGVPVITLPPAAGDAEKAAAEELLKNYRANEKSYIILPNESWKVEILSVGSTGQNQIIEEQVKHHDREILMAVLAVFLDLGSGPTGSFALSKDQSGFFLKAVEEKARYFAEQMNRQVIDRMVYNSFKEDYERLKRENLMPKLIHTPLGDMDFKELSEVLKTLIDAGLIETDTRFKIFTRKAFKLPQLSDDEIDKLEDAELEAELAELEGETVEDEFDFVDDGFDSTGEDEEGKDNETDDGDLEE